MSIFNRNKAKQPTAEPATDPVAEALNAMKNDFTFLEDMLPYEALEELGLDPNDDPEVLVYEAVERSENAKGKYGKMLFDISQGMGEYLIYQSPQGRIAYRLLQNPTVVDDRDFEALRTHTTFDMLNEPIDKVAWSKGWMTTEQWSENMLANTDDPNFKPYTDLDGPDLPMDWLNYKEQYAAQMGPRYPEELKKRHARQAAKKNGNAAQPKQIPKQDIEGLA